MFSAALVGILGLWCAWVVYRLEQIHSRLKRLRDRLRYVESIVNGKGAE